MRRGAGGLEKDDSMPSRQLATQELGSLFGALSHPDRVRIIEELGRGEHDVNTLSEALDSPSSRTSQQLAVLKSHRLVQTRREGRHVYYRLTNPRIAAWVLDGLDFTEAALLEPARMRAAMRSARESWGAEESEGTEAPEGTEGTEGEG